MDTATALSAQPGNTKLSFRERTLLAREAAIVQAVHQLLADKGYDLMTMDEVAAAVGIAKASLYKHFDSKESLAAAAMVRLLEQTLSVAQAQPADASALDKIRGVMRWALVQHLEGAMPTLPSTRSTLRAALMNNKHYVDVLMKVSDYLGNWIEQAQKDGQISSKIPPEAVLYTIFARACDPVLDFLKLGGNYTDDQIVDIVMRTCLDGLSTR